MSLIALPNRPLKLSRAARPGYLGAFFGALVLLVIGTFLMLWQLPGLQHDWKISRNPVLVPEGDVQDGKCTTRKGIFTDCEARLSYDVDGQHYETDVDLMFVDFHSGDYMVDIVRSGDDPSLATMNIGIDKLWNRVILLLVLLVFTLGGGLVLLWQGSRNMRASSMLSRPGKMEAIPVSIESVATSGKRTNITIRNPAGPRAKAKFVSSFKSKEEPLILQTANGKAFGLAVKHQNTPVPVLLDRGLLRLDLTADERAAALASIPG